MLELTDIDRQRFARQISIAGFGEQTQLQLKNSSALVTRAGGLGGTVAMYLAAAGIGRLVVMHGGDVTWSNLNRQILMTQDWVGKPRKDKIEESLSRFNNDMELTVLGEDIDDNNVDARVSEVDVVCDCPPTFEERYSLNRAIVDQGKPMVEAAMNGMEAHLTVLVPGQTPCLKCLYPELSSWWSGTKFPVLGAVSGALACLAAIETVKIVSGFGKPLTGELLSFDTNSHEYRKYKIRRDPNCEVCSHL